MTWLQLTPDLNSLPKERASHCGVCYKNYFYIFGGFSTNNGFK
jgi:hypothetical protein